MAGSSDTPGHLSLNSGGLRAGWAQFTKSGLSFHGYSYVPGVTFQAASRPTASRCESAALPPPTARCASGPTGRSSGSSGVSMCGCATVPRPLPLLSVPMRRPSPDRGSGDAAASRCCSQACRPPRSAPLARLSFSTCPHEASLRLHHAHGPARPRRAACRARSPSASSACRPAPTPSSSAVLALAGGPGPGGRPARGLHREGDRARAARPRPDRL